MVDRTKVNDCNTCFDGYDNEIVNFNHVIDKSNKRVNESSIRRMLQWLIDCDCAFISASRSELKDIRDEKSTYLGPNKDWKEGKRFTPEENRQKNKLMVAKLLLLGYGVTKIKDDNPEEMTDETSRESYLVVNCRNDENFLNNLLRIAEYYNQDSIYYKEKGKMEGSLIGTNNCGWPEYHQKGEDCELKTGTSSNCMSRLGNRAFSFVGNNAEEVNNLKDAEDGIVSGNLCFNMKKMMEALDFWRILTEGRMLIKEELHPLVRKTMGEALRKMR